MTSRTPSGEQPVTYAAPPPARTRLFLDHFGIIRWDVANMAALRRECLRAYTENVHARARASRFKGALVNARIRPTSLALPAASFYLLSPADRRQNLAADVAVLSWL